MFSIQYLLSTFCSNLQYSVFSVRYSVFLLEYPFRIQWYSICNAMRIYFYFPVSWNDSKAYNFRCNDDDNRHHCFNCLRSDGCCRHGLRKIVRPFSLLPTPPKGLIVCCFIVFDACIWLLIYHHINTYHESWCNSIYLLPLSPYWTMIKSAIL